MARAQCCCAEWETNTHKIAVPCKTLARGMQMIRRYFPIQSDFPHVRTRSRRTVSSWSRRCQESEFGRRSAAGSLLLWVPGWHTCGQSGKFAAASSAYDGFCRVVKCKRLMSAVERHTAAGGTRQARARGRPARKFKKHSKTCQTERDPRAYPPIPFTGMASDHDR